MPYLPEGFRPEPPRSIVVIATEMTEPIKERIQKPRIRRSVRTVGQSARAKINNEQYAEIHKALAAGVPPPALARQYAVSRALIHRIKSGLRQELR